MGNESKLQLGGWESSNTGLPTAILNVRVSYIARLLRSFDEKISSKEMFLDYLDCLAALCSVTNKNSVFPTRQAWRRLNKKIKVEEVSRRR